MSGDNRCCDTPACRLQREGTAEPNGPLAVLNVIGLPVNCQEIRENAHIVLSLVRVLCRPRHGQRFLALALR